MTVFTPRSSFVFGLILKIQSGTLCNSLMRLRFKREIFVNTDLSVHMKVALLSQTTIHQATGLILGQLNLTYSVYRICALKIVSGIDLLPSMYSQMTKG